MDTGAVMFVLFCLAGICLMFAWGNETKGRSWPDKTVADNEFATSLHQRARKQLVYALTFCAVGFALGIATW